VIEVATLCRAAEAEDSGLLNLAGAGLQQWFVDSWPANMDVFLALRIARDTLQAVRESAIEVRIVDADGTIVGSDSLTLIPMSNEFRQVSMDSGMPLSFGRSPFLPDSKMPTRFKHLGAPH
jgi:hypothetical protein